MAEANSKAAPAAPLSTERSNQAQVDKPGDELLFEANSGLEDAELDVRLAHGLLRQVIADPDLQVANICGAQALLEKSSRVMRRLIEVQIHGRDDAPECAPHLNTAQPSDSSVVQLLNDIQDAAKGANDYLGYLEATLAQAWEDVGTDEDVCLRLASAEGLLVRARKYVVDATASAKKARGLGGAK